MYEEHPTFVTPPDSSHLWRYLDVARFLSLLNTSKLYFAKISELEDSWEAAHPTPLRNYISSSYLDQDGVPQLVTMYRFMAQSAAVSCWHENQGESIAMWSLYNSGDEGVALQTTVKRLKAAFNHQERRVLIGRVNYIDYETDQVDNPFNVISPLMHKRKSFQHEAEVRALIPFTQEPNAELVDVSPTERRLPDPPLTGISLSVCLPDLIERIVVSPRFPTWAIPALQELVTSAAIKLTVEHSDLLKKPPTY